VERASHGGMSQTEGGEVGREKTNGFILVYAMCREEKFSVVTGSPDPKPKQAP
jgi:hypothetical protein